MRIILTGISCVGKSTIGKILAENIRYRFFDFDNEVEIYYNKPLARFKAEITGFHPEREYQKTVAPLLAKILVENADNIVIAMPPSGLFTPYRHVLDKHHDVIKIVIHDDPQHILNRLVFTDDDSNPMESQVTDENRKYYFSEIKKDITYYKKSYQSANIHYQLLEKDANNGAADLLALVILFKLNNFVSYL